MAFPADRLVIEELREVSGGQGRRNRVVKSSRDSLIQTWIREEQESQESFVGWDFSYLAGRKFEEQPPWSYGDQAVELMRQVGSALDMDTGGGELLLRLREYWPKRLTVTEHYPPNLELATARLTPLGVEVVDVEVTDDGLLPFSTGEFQLVLNRHAAFNPLEVARVLSSGGTFLTQQVHGLFGEDLLGAFDAKPQLPESTPAKYIPRLERAGLSIVDLQEWKGSFAFADVGAIVYYLRAVPWLLPGFSVASHLPYLLQLQKKLDAGEELAFTSRLYMIEAKKEV